MRLRVSILAAAAAALLSCGTYRTGNGQYHGLGDYKTPSDYAKGVDSAGETDSDPNGLKERLNAKATYRPSAPFKLSWPVEMVHIHRGFHASDDPSHQGLDLGGQKGLPIMAAHEGLVIYAGHEFNGYGNMVLLEYNNEWATLYGHLNEISAHEGQILKPGDRVGSMGATGHATGVHLHFELMHNHEPTDPLPLLTRPKFTGRLRGHRQARQ